MWIIVWRMQGSQWQAALIKWHAVCLLEQTLQLCRGVKVFRRPALMPQQMRNRGVTRRQGRICSCSCLQIRILQQTKVLPSLGFSIISCSLPLCPALPVGFTLTTAQEAQGFFVRRRQSSRRGDHDFVFNRSCFASCLPIITYPSYP